MASKKHGLRGSDFENRINLTIDYYRRLSLALIQKIPTPIVPTKLDHTTGQITLAYFEKKSTVDYIGVVQEIPVCFDAKETHLLNKFPMQNIHPHQIQFMKEFEMQGGVSFILINFTLTGDVYYLPFKQLEEFVEGREANNRVSYIKIDELDKKYFIDCKKTLRVNFLPLIQKDIDDR